MKIRITINKLVALADGKDRWGPMVVEVPAATLTPEQRAELAHWATSDYGSQGESTKPEHLRADFEAPSYIGVSRSKETEIPNTLTAAEPSQVIALIDLVAAKRAEVEAARKKKADEEAAEFDAKIMAATAEPSENHIEKDYGRWIVAYPLRCDRAKEIAPAVVAAAEAEAERRTAELKAAAAAEEARAAAHKEAAAKEQAEWIAAHGSNRLKRMAAEEIAHYAVYRDERLASERPGWCWWEDSPGKAGDPRNVPESAFAILDEARKFEPDAVLRYCIIDEATDEYGEEIRSEWRGHIAIADFLGKEIAFGLPVEE